MWKKLIKTFLMYTIFYIVEVTLFSVLLFNYRMDTEISLREFLYSKFVKDNMVTVINSIEVACICFIQNVIEVSAGTVLTGYVFAYILNREPRIIFPNKLVIRHRTSWETKDKITLGILIGNKSSYCIHNVVCSITCSYIKQTEPLLINSEFTLHDERIVLENYYRFSYDLTKFPKQILKDIIEKPTYFQEQTITVCITGNCNLIGNSFKILKKYKLSDIVFDEHVPVISHPRKNIFIDKELVNPFTKKVLMKIKWDEINKVVEADEDRKNISIKEIQYIIRQKERLNKKRK